MGRENPKPVCNTTRRRLSKLFTEWLKEHTKLSSQNSLNCPNSFARINLRHYNQSHITSTRIRFLPRFHNKSQTGKSPRTIIHTNCTRPPQFILANCVQISCDVVLDPGLIRTCNFAKCVKLPDSRFLKMCTLRISIFAPLLVCTTKFEKSRILFLHHEFLKTPNTFWCKRRKLLPSISLPGEMFNPRYLYSRSNDCRFNYHFGDFGMPPNRTRLVPSGTFPRHFERAPKFRPGTFRRLCPVERARKVYCQ